MSLPAPLNDDAALSPLPPPQLVLQFDAGATADFLASKLQSLEVDPNTSFMAKVFGMLPPSVMGSAPAGMRLGALEPPPEMQFVPTPAPAPPSSSLGARRAQSRCPV